MDLNFIKDVATVFGVITSILVATGGLFFYLMKNSFKKGEFYQLLKNLVDKVSSIEGIIEGKFADNDDKHSIHEEKLFEHGHKIAKLEVLNNVKAYRKTKKENN